ncbi:MAG TPA: hypothetical protein VKU90_08095 [Caulobacteraceae bacterium]|nr:hypothetical protein [Caulobacteraceae bacterium]
MTKTAQLLIGLVAAAALGPGSAVAAQTKDPITIRLSGTPHASRTALAAYRNLEPPDPCLKFHQRRAHAHCVSSLAAEKRRHDRLDPYKN